MNLERLVLLMRAVVTVIGKDAVGILAKVSTKCAEYNANVIEVTQSVLQDRKSTRLNSSHRSQSRMPSSA